MLSSIAACVKYIGDKKTFTVHKRDCNMAFFHIFFPLNYSIEPTKPNCKHKISRLQVIGTNLPLLLSGLSIT